MIKVILADDSMIIRSGLKTIIEQDKDIEVLACAENGKQLLELCEKFLPDIVLVDIRMPICDGITAAKLIKERHSFIKVVILTCFYDDADILKALSSGVDGYLLKDVDEQDLIMTIKRTVNKGLNIIHPNVFNTLKKQYENTPIGVADKKKQKVIDLSENEIKVIRFIVEGRSNKEISEQLFLAEGTIRNITSRLLQKFNLEDRTQLAIFAVRNNWV